MICSTNYPPLFEFKASLGESVSNTLDGPVHPYGGYLVRKGNTFAYGFGAANNYGTKEVPLF